MIKLTGKFLLINSKIHWGLTVLYVWIYLSVVTFSLLNEISHLIIFYPGGDICFVIVIGVYF